MTQPGPHRKKTFARALLFLMLIVCGFGVSVLPAHADENFDVGLVSRYTVQTRGLTVIEQEFTLTNKTPTLYASQYAIEVSSNKVQNVKVFNSKGAIPANIVSTDKKTSIGLTFDDVIVGQGKKRTFTVQFESTDVAIISGNVVEVYVPKFTDLPRYDSYRVELRVPEQFGQPERVKPAPTTTTTAGGFTVLEFRELKDQGVTALFGSEQLYDFTLRYHLENTTSSTGLAQVALPPDTSYQRVRYLTLDPKPRIIEKDIDGNWIGTYELPAGRELEVTLSGKASVFLTPQPNFRDPIPTATHRSPQKYWQSDHPRVMELAKQLQTPQQIYEYVSTTLQYNYNKIQGPVTRLGAVEALAQPDQAACQEFTDAFIAIARAAGIPARRITGYSYTVNDRLRPLSLVDDVLHAWPEYYDQEQQRWIAIDPTWGNTTGGLDYFSQLDFNHFAFAINGISDSLPYPAGSYKQAAQKSKDVEVRFGEAALEPTFAATVTIEKDPVWSAPFQNRYTATVSNETGSAWYDLPLAGFATKEDGTTLPLDFTASTIPELLPFQTVRVPLVLQNTSWWQRHAVNLTLTVQDLSSSHDIYTGINPIESLKRLPIHPIALGISLVVTTLIAGGLLVFRRK